MGKIVILLAGCIGLSALAENRKYVIGENFGKAKKCEEILDLSKKLLSDLVKPLSLDCLAYDGEKENFGIVATIAEAHQPLAFSISNGLIFEEIKGSKLKMTFYVYNNGPITTLQNQRKVGEVESKKFIYTQYTAGYQKNASQIYRLKKTYDLKSKKSRKELDDHISLFGLDSMVVGYIYHPHSTILDHDITVIRRGHIPD